MDEWERNASDPAAGAAAQSQSEGNVNTHVPKSLNLVCEGVKELNILIKDLPLNYLLFFPHIKLTYLLLFTMHLSLLNFMTNLFQSNLFIVGFNHSPLVFS